MHEPLAHELEGQVLVEVHGEVAYRRRRRRRRRLPPSPLPPLPRSLLLSLPECLPLAEGRQM